jgi:hypothetical protein
VTSPDGLGVQRRSAPHRLLTLAGVVAIIAMSVAAVAGDWPLWSVVLVTALAVGFSGYAAWLAIRRGARVLAPIAICILALLNPAVINGAVANVQTYAGLVRADPNQFGLVFWKLYPGIAGWAAPEHPIPFDTTGRLRTVQSAMTAAKTTLSAEFGQTWTTDDSEVGVLPVENGYGGRSMFVRIVPAPWQTQLVGAADERATMIDEFGALAASLGLNAEQKVGEPATGDGTLSWAAADEELTLRFEGDRAALTFVGGPFLQSTAFRGEFESRMRPFEGIPQPAPLGRSTR